MQNFEDALRKAGIDTNSKNPAKSPKEAPRKMPSRKELEAEKRAKEEQQQKAIDLITARFDADDDLEGFMRRIGELDKEQHIDFNVFCEIPRRAQRMWHHIGETMTLPGMSPSKIEETRLKTAPPVEWLEKTNDLDLLAKIVAHGQPEAKPAVQEKIAQLLPPINENQVYYYRGNAFDGNGQVFEHSGQAGEATRPGTIGIYETIPHKNGWLEIRDNSYFWHRPAEFNDIPDFPTQEWADDMIEKMREAREKNPEDNMLVALKPGGFWPYMSFEEGEKGLARSLPGGGKIVPQRGWRVRKGVHYNIELTRRLDRGGTTLSGRQYRGVWACRALHPEKDENAHDDWVNNQETSGRFRIEYLYDQNIYGTDTKWIIDVMATGERLIVSPSVLEKIINPKQYFNKEERGRGGAKFMHMGSGILDKKILDKIREAATEHDKENNSDK